MCQTDCITTNVYGLTSDLCFFFCFVMQLYLLFDKCRKFFTHILNSNVLHIKTKGNRYTPLECDMSQSGSSVVRGV